MNKQLFQRNLEIRVAKGKIPMWVIAERLGVHVTTFNGWMRQEMDVVTKANILNIIQQIKEELGGESA